MVSDTECWLSFSITPVQGFIEAARTVRDLAVGSRLLSIMVGEAIRAGRDSQGKLLFPALSADDDRSSLPNQYVMTFRTREEADVAAKNIQIAACKVWEDLAADVRKKLTGKWGNDWDADWADQIKLYWDIRVLVISEQDASEANYQRLFGTKEENPFLRKWRVLAAGLSATKQVRWFPGDHGFGRQKCSLIGEMEQMGPLGSPGALTRWWETQRRTRVGVARIGERDRLCAVSLVKRFAPAVSSHTELKTWATSVSDTAAIATAQWRKVAHERCPDEWGAFTQACDNLNAAMDSEGSGANRGESYARLLLEDSLSWNSFSKEYGKLDPLIIDPIINELRRQRGTLIGIAKNLEIVVTQSTDEYTQNRTYKLGPPPRYLAAIALDGDKIGDRLNQGDSEKFFEDMSRSLLKFAGDTKRIVDSRLGQHIYAGGDDLLSLIHTKECLPCVNELKNAFPANLPGGLSKTTASAGIVLFHYKHDLRDALHQARKAEQEAKNDGRNCVGIRVLKRSGGDIHITAHYEDIERIQVLGDLFREGASFRWLGHVQQLETALECAHQNQLRTQLQYFIRSSEAAPGAEKQLVENRVLELLEQCFSTYGAPKPPEPFRRFMKFLGAATFLARGRN